MTDKSDAWEDDLLIAVFQNTAQGIISSLNITVGAATTLYAALHTASPGEGGAQNVSEATYTGYARAGLLRSAGNWPKQGNNAVDNGAALTFGQRSNTGTETATHVSIGVAVTGATDVLYHGALDTSLVINQNVNPQFAVGALVIEEN